MNINEFDATLWTQDADFKDINGVKYFPKKINEPLVPIYSDPIMFAHDLWHSQIEYLSNSIDLNRKDRAKRYHKSSIVIRQYSIPACPGWVYIRQD